jgi:hypothetical protein
MVTPSQLSSWRPDRLAEIADDVAGHRRVLTRLNDDLDAGAPPASWTLADATAARTEHDRLAGVLATQVSETLGVASALDAAATSIRSAKLLLEGALRRARTHDLHVDLETGAVRTTREYDDPDELNYARTVAGEVSEQITTALENAQAADDALATALTSASTTDVNAVGGLDEQREILDFQELSEADQVEHLLAHPETYALLDDYASPEVKELVGEGIAAELDAAARDSSAFGDPDQVAHYTELLDAFGDDPAVMAPMYDRLGPEGLLATYSGITSMMYVEAGSEELGVLAGELRSGLASATRDEGFDGEAYGEELVRYATHDVSNDERDALSDAYGTEPTGNAAMLDYLLRDGDYGEGFVRGVAWQLDEFERADPDGAAIWAYHDSFANPLNGLDGAEHTYQADPMAAVMGQLGEHPELGLEFFTDGDAGPQRADFYFAERDWSRDSFAGISEAALGIGTDPENLANSHAETGRFVSEFFDRLPENPEFNAEHAAGAAEPVADLLKHYMPAVESAASSNLSGDSGPQVTDFDTNDFLPKLTDYPVLDREDLDGLLKVALSTEDGTARIAEGVAGLRQERLAAFAQQHPDAEAVAANAQALESILTQSADLEGYMQHTLGEIAIDGAVSREQQVAAFTGLVSEAVGLIPVPGADEIGGAVGELGKNAWEAAWNQAGELPSERIDEAFDNNSEATREEVSGEAARGRARMTVATVLSLADAGLIEIPAEMRDTWMPGGDLVGLESIKAEDLQDFQREAGDTLGSLLSVQNLRDAYRDPFAPWYSK